jgi:hypothetical protein
VDVSYAVRVSSGKCSMRTNIVGTIWVTVTRNRSIAASASSASNRSITTTVPPKAWTDAHHFSGAV